MKKTLFSHAAVLAATFFLFSCKKNYIETTSPPPPPGVKQIAAKWDSSVARVAGITNQLLKQKDFKDYLKVEVLKTFDGDYDVLLSTVAKHLKNYLVSTSASRLSTTDPYSAEQIAVLEAISLEFPQMQLSVQTDPNNWNTATYTPPVTYLVSTYDEATTLYVPVVDNEGNVVGQIDAQVEPLFPVVIVSGNERTLVSPNGDVVLSQPVDAYYGLSYDVLLSDSLPPIDPNPTLLWYRQNYKYESVYALIYEEIGKIEGWPAGGPETRIYTYNTDDPLGINYKKEGSYHGEKWAKRKDIKKKWFVFESAPINCHLWRWNQTGTTIKYGFYEYDDAVVTREETDSIASFITRVTDSSAVGTIVGGAIQLVGLFLKKDNDYSEFIGELEISANNNAIEFRKGSGGFGWRSKPF